MALYKSLLKGDTKGEPSAQGGCTKGGGIPPCIKNVMSECTTSIKSIIEK